MSNILDPNSILNTIHYVVNSAGEKFYKNGIELEKGAIITERRIEKNRKVYEKYADQWSIYPDLFLDLIKTAESHFNLFFYQRYFLRLCMRYGRIVVIAPRA